MLAPAAVINAVVDVVDVVVAVVAVVVVHYQSVKL